MLGTVSRRAACRRYHVAREMFSASHGLSFSLLPSGDALALRAFPFCLAERAACRAMKRRACQPCACQRARYRSTLRAVAATLRHGERGVEFRVADVRRREHRKVGIRRTARPCCQVAE